MLRLQRILEGCRLKVLSTLNFQNGCVVPTLASHPNAGLAPEQVIDGLLSYGCCRFDLVDLDAAQSRGNNRALIASVIRKIRHCNQKVCIQVGGGIRSSDQAQFFMDSGATWLVVGTVLHRFPLIVDQLLGRFRENLVASMDVRSGDVLSSGGLSEAGVSAVSMALRIRDLGFRRIMFTEMPMDPASEPDFATVQAICEQTHVPIYMGGSIRTPAHLAHATEVRGLQGILVDAVTLLEFPDMIRSSVPACS